MDWTRDPLAVIDERINRYREDQLCQQVALAEAEAAEADAVRVGLAAHDAHNDAGEQEALVLEMDARALERRIARKIRGDQDEIDQLLEERGQHVPQPREGNV